MKGANQTYLKAEFLDRNVIATMDERIISINGKKKKGIRSVHRHPSDLKL